jgi:hypothetical protein
MKSTRSHQITQIRTFFGGIWRKKTAKKAPFQKRDPKRGKRPPENSQKAPKYAK